MDQRLFKLFTTLILASYTAMAAPTSTTNTPTKSNLSSFPTITDTEGTGDIPGGVGSVQSGTPAGASGGSGGAFSLSTGAIVGIAVPVGLLIAIIIPLWVVWFIAKRRQWTMKETITRASRRLTGRKNPPATPRTVNRRRNVSVYGTRDAEKGFDSASERSRSRSRTPEEARKEMQKPVQKPVPSQSRQQRDPKAVAASRPQ